MTGRCDQLRKIQLLTLLQNLTHITRITNSFRSSLLYCSTSVLLFVYLFSSIHQSFDLFSLNLLGVGRRYEVSM